MNLQELILIIEKSREKRNEQNKFLAAIQGIDLEKNKDSANADFEEVRRRAQARISGKSEEEIEFEQIGIDIQEWED